MLVLQLVNGVQLSVEEWTVLREYFQRIGRSVLEAKEEQKINIITDWRK